MPLASTRNVSGAPYAPQSMATLPSASNADDDIRIAELLQPALRHAAIVLPVQADDAALRRGGRSPAAPRAPAGSATHQLPQTFTTYGLPGELAIGNLLRRDRRRAAARTAAPACRSAATAASACRGPRPTNRKPTSAANRPMGMQESPHGCVAHAALVPACAATGGIVGGDALAIASVEHRDEAADGDDERAQPDESHHRLVLQAQAPGAVAQRLAHRDEQVAVPAARRCRLRSSRSSARDRRASADAASATRLPSRVDDHFALDGFVVRAGRRRAELVIVNVKPASSVLCPGRRLRSFSCLYDSTVVAPRMNMARPKCATLMPSTLADSECPLRQRARSARPAPRTATQSATTMPTQAQHRAPAVGDARESQRRARCRDAAAGQQDFLGATRTRLASTQRACPARAGTPAAASAPGTSRSKYGGPDRKLPRSNASRNIGYSVPSRITAVAATSSTLFISRNDSRETGAKPALDVNSGARQAYSTSAPPTQITEEREDEQAARRIARERVHRLDDAGAHQERSEQRQRERGDRQQQRPALEQPALLRHRQRVNQRGADQPRHERRVLDRIPEPPAAPAELVVSPPAAERDADGEEQPRDRRPRPHPARPHANRACLPASRRPRTRTAPRSRHSRCRASADGSTSAGSCSSGFRSRPSGAAGHKPLERIRRHENEQREAGADQAEHAEHATGHRRRACCG